MTCDAEACSNIHLACSLIKGLISLYIVEVDTKAHRRRDSCDLGYFRSTFGGTRDMDGKTVLSMFKTLLAMYIVMFAFVSMVFLAGVGTGSRRSG